MGTLRALLRVVLLLIVALLAWATWMLGRVPAWIVPALAVPLHLAPVRWWARSSLRILGVRLTVEGTPPRPPFVLVLNHLSYVDILVVLAHVDALMLSKSEVGSWPLIGFLARSTGTLFVDRRRAADIPRVLEDFQRTWDAGLGVTFFPEGTSTDGTDMLPFKSSLFAAPARAGKEVWPAAIVYRTRPGAPSAADSVCWWGDDEFAPHTWALAKVPGFDATLVFGDRPVHADDRKELARLAEERVRDLFRPST